jgi:hypothetical protein
MGKVKGKVVNGGDTGMLSYKDDSGTKIEVPYNQVFSTDLGIAVNTRVSFDLITVGGKPMAVAVNPVENGDIVEIDTIKGKGVIIEKESGIKYPFSQNFLAESGFIVGQAVKYTLVNINGIITATCLTV